MYSSSDSTTWAARYFFMSFIVLIGLLFSQLFVGMIMTLISEAQQLNSIRLSSFLRPFFVASNELERARITNTLLKLNATLSCIQDAISILNSDVAQLRPLFEAISQGHEDTDAVHKPASLQKFVRGHLKHVNIAELLQNNPWLDTFCSNLVGSTCDPDRANTTIMSKVHLLALATDDTSSNTDGIDINHEFDGMHIQQKLEDTGLTYRNGSFMRAGHVREPSANQVIGHRDIDPEIIFCEPGMPESEDQLWAGSWGKQLEGTHYIQSGASLTSVIHNIVSYLGKIKWLNLFFGAVAVLIYGGLTIAVTLSLMLDASFGVLEDDKVSIGCQSQSHSAMVTAWLTQDLYDTVARSAVLSSNRDVWTTFNDDQQINGTLTAVLMGLVSANVPSIGKQGSLFVVWQDVGSALSAQTDGGSVTAHLYRSDTSLCWEAPFNSATGYGTWVQSSTGPLGASCSSVTGATWYTRAMGLNNNSTSTLVESISTG